ncbi:hypothetical protein ACIPIN_14400 [Pseudomonas sp. NPDC087697]|uniref:hypothetical protein n=1 Tax=Pseudomonas sp. NPDC087697 TaxID=3364447 RepID=UPI0037F98516
MTEDQLGQEALGWLGELGYTHVYGPTIAPDGESPERDSYREVVLVGRLRSAIDRLSDQHLPNPPEAAAVIEHRRNCRPKCRGHFTKAAAVKRTDLSSPRGSPRGKICDVERLATFKSMVKPPV